MLTLFELSSLNIYVVLLAYKEVSTIGVGVTGAKHLCVRKKTRTTLKFYLA